MRPNPFRLTLALLGIGLIAIGAFLWLMGAAAAADPVDPGNGPVLLALGPAVMGAGWLPFTAWLLVGALHWVPKPAEPGRSEAEIRELLQQKSERG